MEEGRPIVVTGGDGALASYAQGCVLLNKKDADVTDPHVVETLARHNPRAIIHLAALTDQRACDENPSLAYMINAIGAYHVALAARNLGAQLCFVSTNAVFDGGEGAPFAVSAHTNPQNMYGKSKYAGELLVRGVLPKALIVRSSWIFGGGPMKDKKFIGKIMQQLKEGMEELKAVSDVSGTPTYGKDLMSAILELLSQNNEGVVHVTNEGIASRYDMATRITKIINRGKVSRISRLAYNAPANEALTGITLRPWQEALDEYITSQWMTT